MTALDLTTPCQDHSSPRTYPQPPQYIYFQSAQPSPPAHHPTQPAKQPSIPALHVLPKATKIALSLVKPASTLTQATDALARTPIPTHPGGIIYPDGGHTAPGRSHRISCASGLGRVGSARVGVLMRRLEVVRMNGFYRVLGLSTGPSTVAVRKASPSAWAPAATLQSGPRDSFPIPRTSTFTNTHAGACDQRGSTT